MFTITFTVDDTVHSIELQPSLGDLNELYGSGEEIVERIEQLGFEYTGEPPSFQDLSRRHRESRDSESLDIGDLSDVVRERDDEGEAKRKDNEDDGFDTNGTGSDDDANEIELVFIGPDGDRLSGTYRPNQSLGAAQADIAERADLDRDQQVIVYQSNDRERALPNQTPLADLAGKTLYWEPRRL